jgi:hypothetical protein
MAKKGEGRVRPERPRDGHPPDYAAARMNEWLQRVAREIGSDEELSNEDADALLKIARIAAHEGGDRTNAPLLAYLIGRSRGDRALTEILETVRRSSS